MMLLSVVLQLLCFSILATASDKNGVKYSKTPFPNAAANLYYFEDSDVILIHDQAAGDVLRSDDAGDTWGRVEDVDQGAAVGLAAHPYDKSVAYI